MLTIYIAVHCPTSVQGALAIAVEIVYSPDSNPALKLLS